LKEHCGITAIIFDKDNTLTAPYDLQTHPDAVKGLEAALSVFGPERVAILSNSAGTTADDPGYTEALKIERDMGVQVIRHDEKKPGGLQEVLAHFSLDEPQQICMVGDRLLTDIVFGNLYGMLTVHCLPLCKGADNARDNTVSKYVRSMENTLLYSNWFGSRMLVAKRIPHKYWAGEHQVSLVLLPEEFEAESSQL
jgi:phosphatidylglycerophosphatase GEP4